MVDDVRLAKCEIIERCLNRVETLYQKNSAAIGTDFDVQDAIVLNLQRACQASIDLAMHLIKRRGLGLPKDSRDAFVRLSEAGLIDADLSTQLQKMVGFRNIAIHDYQQLDIKILAKIITHGTGDLRRFANKMVSTS